MQNQAKMGRISPVFGLFCYLRAHFLDVEGYGESAIDTILADNRKIKDGVDLATLMQANDSCKKNRKNQNLKIFGIAFNHAI